MTEDLPLEYRFVPGHENYRVSNYGTVQSLKKDGSWRNLLANPGRQGYPAIGISENGKSRQWFVHTLVLTAFVGPRPDGMVCRHLNDDPRDNRLVNLTWGTKSENCYDSVANRESGNKPYKTRLKKQIEPYYRSQRDTWCIQIGKKQVTLAKGRENRAAAWREYHRFMASLGRGEKVKDIGLALACDLFLDSAKDSVSPGAFEQYRIKLDDFVRHNRRLRLAELEADHVARWVKRHDWSASTARGAITAVKVCLAWCARKGYVPADPVKDVKRPKMGRRRRTLTPDERKEIRAATEGPLLDYLDALTWTGARPGEIMQLEAAHIDWDEAIARLPGKTTRATGEMIEFPLVPPMLALCRRLAGRYPEGPLFRNAGGNPWTINSVRCRMRRLRAKLGLAGVTAYTFRHSFATDALERGVPVTDLAALMNHKDIRTTMNYNHIKERRDHLGRQARKAVGDPPPGSTSPS